MGDTPRHPLNLCGLVHDAQINPACAVCALGCWQVRSCGLTATSRRASAALASRGSLASGSGSWLSGSGSWPRASSGRPVSLSRGRPGALGCGVGRKLKIVGDDASRLKNASEVATYGEKF